MSVWKIKQHDISSFKTTPKELSQFWKSYFARLSISMSKMFYNYMGQKSMIQFISRDILRGRDYFENVGHFSVIQPFTILPHGEIGFVHLSDGLCNYLINYLQGGQWQDPDIERKISETDKKLLAPLVAEILFNLKNHFNSEQIEVVPVESDNILLYANSFQSEQLISTQIFSFEVGGEVYTFTVAMGNRMLEQFISL